MAILIVVEDGNSPANANSYINVAGVRTFAINRGIDLTTLTDDQIAAFLIKANDYLESLADRYVGCINSIAQPMQWPRANVINVDGSSFPNVGAGSIPKVLPNAQAQLVIEQNNGVDLMPTVDHNADGGFVVRRKVDVLETQFSERIGTSKAPLMPKVEFWLASIMQPSTPGLMCVRV